MAVHLLSHFIMSFIIEGIKEGIKRLIKKLRVKENIGEQILKTISENDLRKVKTLNVNIIKEDVEAKKQINIEIRTV